MGYDFLEKDKTLFNIGDPGSKFYIILSGSVSVEILAGDILKRVAILNKGDSDRKSVV